MSQLIFALLFAVCVALGIGVVIYLFSGIFASRLPLEGEGVDREELEAPEDFKGKEFPAPVAVLPV